MQASEQEDLPLTLLRAEETTLLDIHRPDKEHKPESRCLYRCEVITKVKLTQCVDKRMATLWAGEPDEADTVN